MCGVGTGVKETNDSLSDRKNKGGRKQNLQQRRSQTRISLLAVGTSYSRQRDTTVRLWIHFCTRPQLSAAPTFTPLCIVSHLFQPDTAQKWTLKPRNRKPAQTFLSFLWSFFKKKKKKSSTHWPFYFSQCTCRSHPFFSPSPLPSSDSQLIVLLLLTCACLLPLPSPHPFPATHSSPHPSSRRTMQIRANDCDYHCYKLQWLETGCWSEGK